MNEHIIYLALGSNIGNRAANLKQALASLPPQVEVTARSKVYDTPPWGYVNQEAFLNQVVQASTYLDPLPLLKHIKRLEIALGRVESFRYGPRLIDIDILFYDEIMMATTELVIPHPNTHERGFVLKPLMDINPELYHPIKQKTVRELAAVCDMTGIVPVKKDAK